MPGAAKRKTEPPPLFVPAEPAGRRVWFVIAATALAIATGAAAFTEVHNFDVFWHLDAGQWMLQHGHILSHDPYSIDPLPEWMNMHWLFQVVVAALHAVGGFGALVWMKAGLAAATAVLLALASRKDTPPAWLIVAGLLAAVAIETRMRVRPEAFTLVFFMATIAVVESVRRSGGAKRLWLLPAIMLPWVNMHGMYILGPAVFWSAYIGAWIDRRLGQGVGGGLATRRALWPLLAATAACFVSPWPIEAAAQPFVLWTRMSGQTEAYSLGNLELIPTWMYWKSPQFFVIAVVLLTLAGAVCVANVRRVPASHWMWLVATGVLAMLARRNVCLTGPVCGYLLAVHGGQVIRQIAARKGTGSEVAQPRRCLSPVHPINLAALLLALAFAAGCATEVLFRWQGFGRRFGPGLCRPNYPIDIARHLGTLKAPGDVFCANWADASVFMHFSRPRKIWMDGRLEAHTVERFQSQQKIAAALDAPAEAGAVKLPPQVRFFYVPNTYRKALSSMARSWRFKLVRTDEVGVCFERMDYPGRAGGLLPSGDNLGDFDRPLLPSGQIDGLPANERRWCRQNPPSRYRPIANALLWTAWRPLNEQPDTGDELADRAGLLAIRYLEAARIEGLCEPTSAMGLLAQAYHQRARRVDFEPTDAAPIDWLAARALYLYGQLDLNRLGVEDIRAVAEQHVDALVRARRLDSAATAAEYLVLRAPRDLPPDKLDAWMRLERTLRVAASDSLRRAEPLPADPVERARLLASPALGLADQAIKVLRKIPETSRTSEAWLLLGDLLLSAGRVDDARAAYRQCNIEAAAAWRLILCDWVEDPVTGGDMPAGAPPAAQACERTRQAILGRRL